MSGTSITKVHKAHSGRKSGKGPLRKSTISSLQKKRFACGTCHEGFKSIVVLNEHMQFHANEKEFQCFLCGELHMDTELLYAHIDSHDTPRYFKCGLCDTSFRENSCLLEHIAEKHEELPTLYKCNVCELLFKDIAEIKSHAQENHPPVDLKFECGICHKQFVTSKQLSKHLRAHSRNASKSTNGPCSETRANVLFIDVVENKTKRELQIKPKKKETSVTPSQAVSTKESQKATQPIKSDVEDNDSNSSDLGDYNLDLPSLPATNSHSGAKSYSGKYAVECGKCNRAFDDVKLLCGHLTETDCQGYKCETCGEMFELETQLMKHVAGIHTEKIDGIFKCTQCSKTFGSAYPFSRHVSTHCTSKPFMCKVCGRRYVMADHFFHHYRNVHSIDSERDSDSKYSCDQCEKKFANEKALKIHCTAVHAQDSCRDSSVSKILDKNTSNSFSEDQGFEKVLTTSQCVLDGTELQQGISESRKLELTRSGAYFDCDVCMKRLYNIDGFYQHRNGHFFDGNYSAHCHVCGKDFNSLDDLNSHIDGKMCVGFLCTDCGETFVLQSYLFSHEAKVHSGGESEKGIYSCKKCHKIFESISQYVRHAATHADIKSFLCKLCNKWFVSPETLNSHLRNTHSLISDRKHSKFKCSLCYLAFLKFDALKTHHQQVHGMDLKTESNVNNTEAEILLSQSAPTCEICSKTFASHTILRQHKRSHFGGRWGRAKRLKPKACNACPICKKTFTRAWDMQKHLGVHTRPFLCSQCGRSFSCNTSLKNHIRVNHSEENPFRCELCQKSYSSKFALKIHTRLHTNEKPYQCHQCQKRFTQWSSLRSHLKMHSSEKPHKCFVCGYRCRHSSGLKQHLSSHRKEKTHICQVCNKGFTLKKYLTNHMKLHSGVKSHVCTVCGQGFSRQAYLSIHMRTHTNEKPHPCPVCNRPFAVSSNMMSHVKKIHPEYKYTYNRPTLDNVQALQAEVYPPEESHSGQNVMPTHPDDRFNNDRFTTDHYQGSMANTHMMQTDRTNENNRVPGSIVADGTVRDNFHVVMSGQNFMYAHPNPYPDPYLQDFWNLGAQKPYNS